MRAFEPTPSTRDLALKNISRFSQVQVHPHAAWSSATRLTFTDYGLTWMAFNSFTNARMPSDRQLSGRPFSVETTTVDALRKDLGRPISLLKIDAESAEEHILQGSEETIARDHPIISLEVGDSGAPGTSVRLIEFLKDRGYAPWECTLVGLKRHKQKTTYEYDNLIFADQSLDLSTL